MFGSHTKSQQYTIPLSVRSIAFNDLQFSETDLGEGTFGKCFKAQLAHLNTCVKVFRNGTTYESTFAVEATLSLLP